MWINESRCDCDSFILLKTREAGSAVLLLKYESFIDYSWFGKIITKTMRFCLIVLLTKIISTGIECFLSVRPNT